MKLSEHFTLEELTFSSTAIRLGISNSPTEEVTTILTSSAEQLEQVRKLLNNPMHIDSGYRSPELNTAVKGAKNSAHVLGYAIDFICPRFGTPLEITKAINGANIKFDQVIQEGTWVHISFAPAMRQQVLTAHFWPNGSTSYSQGV